MIVLTSEGGDSVTWMTMLLAVGSSCRLTRLIGQDTITFAFRDWLAGKSENIKDMPCNRKPQGCWRQNFFGFVEDMVSCPWCLSIWMAAPVAVCAWFFGDTGWFMVPALLLTASQVSGVVMTRGA